MPRLLTSLPFIVWILVPVALTQRVDPDFDTEFNNNPKCRDCTNCCNNRIVINCVSSDMQVEEQTKGIVSVHQLTSGDIIRGIMGADRTPSWCKVEAVYPFSNATTYDGFTANHMVVNNGSVVPHGMKGKENETRIFSLATECDAAVNAAGLAFTSISTAFCPREMSWSEYLPLMAAIRRVTDRTGFFWYSSDAFHNNETANVTRWMDRLHEMCIELLWCVNRGRCQQFENVMAEVVRDHLNETYEAVVMRVFPNIGGDVGKGEAGTITGVVRPQGTPNNTKNNTVLIPIVTSVIAVLVVIIVVAVLVYRKQLTRNNKETKMPLLKHPSVNSQDLRL